MDELGPERTRLVTLEMLADPSVALGKDVVLRAASRFWRTDTPEQMRLATALDRLKAYEDRDQQGLGERGSMLSQPVLEKEVRDAAQACLNAKGKPKPFGRLNPR